MNKNGKLVSEREILRERVKARLQVHHNSQIKSITIQALAKELRFEYKAVQREISIMVEEYNMPIGSHSRGVFWIKKDDLKSYKAARRYIRNKRLTLRKRENHLQAAFAGYYQKSLQTT